MTEQQTDGWKDKQMGEQMDGGMVQWSNGQTDGQTD